MVFILEPLFHGMLYHFNASLIAKSMSSAVLPLVYIQYINMYVYINIYPHTNIQCPCGDIVISRCILLHFRSELIWITHQLWNGYAVPIHTMCIFVHVFQIDILCNEELLGKDHTLKFVAVTRWRVKVDMKY